MVETALTEGTIISLANIVVQSNINAFGTAVMAGCVSFNLGLLVGKVFWYNKKD